MNASLTVKLTVMLKSRDRSWSRDVLRNHFDGLGVGLGLGLEACGLGLGLGLEGSSLVNIPVFLLTL